MKTIYECSHSKGMKWLTVVGCIIIVAAMVFEVWSIWHGMNMWLGVVVILILVAALLSAFLCYPQYIIATDEGIGIHTLVRTHEIPYSNIERIERADKDFMGWGTIRLCGISGMLGNIGWFRSADLGTYIAYVTDKSKAFIIYRKEGKPIAISVSEPDEFMPYYLKSGEQ